MFDRLRRGSLGLFTLATMLLPSLARAEEGTKGHSEADLVMPDLSVVEFFGVPGTTLLMAGIAVCALGAVFSYVAYNQLRALPVHQSMADVSHLIYETCKTYLT